MILEIEDETRDFVTIYKKDFRDKKAEQRNQYKPKSTYPPPLNLLNGPYKKCLNTRRKNLSLPLDEQTEDPQEYLNRIREKYLRLKNFLPEVVPNEDLIERKETELTQTVYNLDYSKGDYSLLVNIYGRWKNIPLPEDWVISETVQRKSYRNPWKTASKNLLRITRVEKPVDNIIPSKKEREILRVKTGKSEYEATIAAIGNKIMEEKLIGEPLHIGPTVYAKRSNTSTECTQILTEKIPTLRSNIF